MKRDMALIRGILLELEKRDCPVRATELVKPGYDYDTVVKHLELMSEAELIDAAFVWADDSINIVTVDRITWNGYEFLASVKSEDVWRKVSTKIANNVLDASIALFTQKAIEYASLMVG